jgi:gluconolactonase
MRSMMKRDVNSRALAAMALCLAGPALVAGQAAAPQQGQPQAARRVTISAISGVVAAGATWTLAWSGTDNADGIVGTSDDGLLFAQEQPNRISKLDRNDKVSVHVEDTHGTGSIGIDARGRIIAAQRTCTDPGSSAPCSEPTKIAILDPASDRRVLADSVDGKSFGRPNDLVVGTSGGVYFTSGGAYYLSPSGSVRAVGENLRTNGIMLSRDEKTLYVTNGAVVVAFDVRPDGAVANQRDFGRLDAGGTGDGLAIDAEGRLYVTSAPGVQVFSPEGTYLGLIPTPRNAISTAFAGPDKRTLYVVGSGAVDRDGKEIITPAGVRNNAKSIFRIPMLAQGFRGRPK